MTLADVAGWMGRQAGRVESRLRSLLLCPWGHDDRLWRETGRIALECQRCGRISKGWEVKARGAKGESA